MAIDWSKITNDDRTWLPMGTSDYMQMMRTACANCGKDFSQHSGIHCIGKRPSTFSVDLPASPPPQTLRSAPSSVSIPDQSAAFLNWLVAPPAGCCPCGTKRSVCVYHKDSEK